MILETTRLKIVPLTKGQFRLLLDGVNRLEEAMNWTSSCKQLDADTQLAMEGLYKESLSHPHHYLWYTNWQIVLKSENKAIGSLCFMREPDCNGEVEIGYGINDDYRNNGYMTEAVACMCRWAFLQENVMQIIAETEMGNHSSQRVLEKSGMIRYMYKDNNIWWRIKKKT